MTAARANDGAFTTSASIDDPAVVRALQEYRTAAEAGRPPARSEFLARFPALTGELAACLDALDFVCEAAPLLCADDHDSAAAGEAPGTPLGDYLIVREIGRGGMGIVYEARQLSLDRLVALKVLPFAPALDARQRERFRNEAQAAAHLQHQNIVPVYGVGCERGVHFYAMQYVEGRTLADLVAELRGANDANTLDTTTTRISTPTTAGSPRSDEFCRTMADLMRQAADGLDHAHERGVVHRDIKPANLLLDARDNLWITDFGLARLSHDPGLTRTGDLVGTLRYMSPEQIRARADLVDHRTDIYSLGATFYEALTLEPVFHGRDRQDILQRIAWQEPRAPRQLNRAITPELEVIVQKTLAKDPAERYATARELADDLRRFLDDRPILARRPTILQRLRRWSRRHRAILGAVAACSAIALLLAAAGLAASHSLILHERDRAVAARRRAEAAERRAIERLYEALVARASEARQSGRIGARAEGLAALAEAAGLSPGSLLEPARRLALRNEVIACYGLSDFHFSREWAGYPSGSRRVAFDAHLIRYARLDDSGTISVRRVEDDRELVELSVSGAVPESALLFSPDARYLGVRRQMMMPPRVTIWDLQAPQIVVDAEAARNLDFSPDSRQAAISRIDGSVGVFDLDSRSEIERFNVGRSDTADYAVTYSPRGDRLAIGGADHMQIQVWSLNPPRRQRTIPAPAPVGQIAWHPDGRRLASSLCPRVFVFDADTGKVLLTLEGHQTQVYNVTFGAGGDLLASSSFDGTTRLWDVDRGRQVARLPNSTATNFSGDGLRLPVREGNRVRFLEVGRNPEHRVIPASGTRTHSVSADPLGRWLVLCGGSGARFWDLTTGKEMLLPSGDAVHAVQFDPRGTHLYTSTPAGVHRWPIAATSSGVRIGPPELLHAPETTETARACLSRDGTVLAVVGGQGRAVVLETKTRAVRARLHQERADLHYPAIDPLGRWVASGHWAGSEVRVWDARTGAIVHRLPYAAGTAARVAFSPDGRWLVACVAPERDYHVLETGTWMLRRKQAADSSASLPGPVAFSDDGRIMAFASSLQVIKLVDPESGTELATLEAPDTHILASLGFTPDGGLLAALTEDGVTHLWDLRRIRAGLAALGLDWNLPPIPPAAHDQSSEPMPVELDLGVLDRGNGRATR
jgi:serine/threonine protein kinase/WD40 repeat protein